MCGFCNVWVCVCVGFEMCGCFGNMCTCIYCVLCCLYCFFYVCLFLFVLSVLMPSSDNSTGVSNDDDAAAAAADDDDDDNNNNVRRSNLVYFCVAVASDYF